MKGPELNSGPFLFLMDTCFLYNTTMAFVTSREHVQQLAEMVLSELPEEFREYFSNISVLIEDIPS